MGANPPIWAACFGDKAANVHVLTWVRWIRIQDGLCLDDTDHKDTDRDDTDKDDMNQDDIMLVSEIREGVRMKKTFLNGHCPFRGGGRPLPGCFGPFFY